MGTHFNGRGSLIVGCAALLLLGAGIAAAEDGCDAYLDATLSTDEVGGAGEKLQFAVDVSTEAECAKIVFDLVLEVQLPNGHANRVRLERQVKLSDGGETSLVRYTLPINRFPDPAGGNATGIGDFNVFAAYLIDTGNPSLSFGIGPQLTAPTATEDGTGAGKWSLGLANVLFSAANPKFQWGYLLTWQASVAGSSQSRPDVNAGAFQPLLIAQLGKGWYLRSTAIWTYDFETDNYNIPIGLGAGRVVKTKKAVVNYFIEPQVSVASRGPGQADWGVFAGVNFHFPK